VIALLVWPRPAHSVDSARSAHSANQGRLAGRAAEPTAFGGLLGRRGAQLVWVALWGSLAWYLLLPRNRAPSGIGDAVAGTAAGEPGWIHGIEKGLGQSLAHHGTEVSVLLAAVCVMVALGAWFRQTLRPAVVVAGVLGAAIWVGEAFGGIFSGAGTDPNSGLILVLLACCYWPISRAAARGQKTRGRRVAVRSGGGRAARPAHAARWR